MLASRIYLGIDTHSNLAIALENAGNGVFFLTISTGARGEDLCKFLCSEEELAAVIHNHPLEIEGHAGTCCVTPAGDEILFEFKRAGDEETSKCSLSTNSFMRVLNLAKSRAYIG